MVNIIRSVTSGFRFHIRNRKCDHVGFQAHLIQFSIKLDCLGRNGRLFCWKMNYHKYSVETFRALLVIIKLFQVVSKSFMLFKIIKTTKIINIVKIVKIINSQDN